MTSKIQHKLVYKTETDSQTQRTDLWLPMRREMGDGLEVWDEQTRAVVHRMDGQQGPTAQHKGLYSIPCDKPSWKRTGKRICVYIYTYS